MYFLLLVLNLLALNVYKVIVWLVKMDMFPNIQCNVSVVKLIVIHVQKVNAPHAILNIILMLKKLVLHVLIDVINVIIISLAKNVFLVFILTQKIFASNVLLIVTFVLQPQLVQFVLLDIL